MSMYHKDHHYVFCSNVLLLFHLRLQYFPQHDIIYVLASVSCIMLYIHAQLQFLTF
jgi:hypothetical protein